MFSMFSSARSSDRTLSLDIPVLPMDVSIEPLAFGDDVYKYIGCAAGMYQDAKSFEEELGMDTTANFLGPGKRFDGDRISIHYFDFGNKESGESILLLAGLGSLMRSWSPILVQGLAVYNRVVMMDYPGQGGRPSEFSSVYYNDSSNPLPPYSIDFMATSAYRLLEYLNINNPKTNIMGRSMGSIVALQMGLLFGDNLGKIIPVSNVILNTAEKSARLRDEATSNVDVQKIYYPIDYKEGGCAIAQWLCYKYDAQEVYRGLMSWTDNKTTTGHQRKALDEFLNNGKIEGFRSMRNPVMAIQGMLDNTAPVGNLIELSNLVPNFKRWVLMDYAGHAVTDEYLTFITTEIQSFLSDIGIEDQMTGFFPAKWYYPNYGGACNLNRCTADQPDSNARSETARYQRPTFLHVGNSGDDLKSFIKAKRL